LTAYSEIESKTHGFELGAVDYITKPFNLSEVQARIHTHLSLAMIRKELEEQNETLEHLVDERTKEIQLLQEITIESMGTLAEYRDPETGGHIQRTKRYLLELAIQLKTHPHFKDFLTERNIRRLYQSAPLHDIGKVGVSDDILLKPGRLTPEEFEAMKQHTVYGRDALETADGKLEDDSFLTIAKEIAYSHHERWDGTGYPEGLKEREIPISGRLMAVADVYDALISKRVYKEAFSHEKAVEIIVDGRGKHFDPDIVDAFLAVEKRFFTILNRYND